MELLFPVRNLTHHDLNLMGLGLVLSELSGEILGVGIDLLMGQRQQRGLTGLQLSQLGFELRVLGSELLDGLLVLGSASNGILQIVDSISGFVRLLKA